MILKERTKSVSHLILESLNSRTILSSKEKAQYDNQYKGYNGELQFDSQMKEAGLPGYVINDLLISTRDTSFQIDSLLVTDDHIYLYEVKNYTGSYYYRDGDICSESGHVLQNPMAQADRKRSYLYNSLLSMGYQIDISIHVVFINPDFYIYLLPKTPDILFAGQLSSHFKSIANITNDQKNEHFTPAKKITAMHEDTYRPSNLPDYPYHLLKKGIKCQACFSFEYSTSRQIRTCTSCGLREKSKDAIYRSIEEFRLLFPEKRLTKKIISEWCGNDWSESRIKRTLNQHYQLHLASRSSYYN